MKGERCICILGDCRCRLPVDTITIDVEVDVTDVYITYSNQNLDPWECGPRNLGGGDAGTTIDIPFLPECGDMTISASSIYYNCQYNGTQRNVVIEAIPGGGCGGNCGGCSIQAIII